MNENICNINVKVKKSPQLNTIIIINQNKIIHPHKTSCETDEFILKVKQYKSLTLTVIQYNGKKYNSIFSISNTPKNYSFLKKINYLLKCGDKFSFSKITFDMVSKKDGKVLLISDDINTKEYNKTVFSIRDYKNVKIKNIKTSNWCDKKQKKRFFSVLISRIIIPGLAILILLLQYEGQNIKYWNSYEVTVGGHNFFWAAFAIVGTIVFSGYFLNIVIKKFKEIT